MMYQTAQVLQSVEAHVTAVLVLCGLSLCGNYVMWAENLRLGFRDRRYSMPVGSVFFFLAHDGTYIALYRHWFDDIHHWFPELWWFGLCVTFGMELAFLVMLLRTGRAELAPRLSQGQFTGLILLGIGLTTIAWLTIKSTMDDDLFLTIFGVTVFWCGIFSFGLMASRRDAVGQSVLAWCGYLAMTFFYWAATWILAPGFHSALWIALGAACITTGVANIMLVRGLNATRVSATGTDVTDPAHAWDGHGAETRSAA